MIGQSSTASTPAPLALFVERLSKTYGPTLAKAFETMELLEWACDLYLRTLPLGEPRVLTAEQTAAVVTTSRERQYGSVKRVRKSRR